MPIEVDQNGIVVSGKFTGHKLEDVLAYTETLEAAIVEDGKAKPAAPTAVAPPPNPLAVQANARLAPLQNAMATRLEQDDEAAFAASVPDYAQYKARIDELKKGLTPDNRMQRGVHRFLYTSLKSQDPKVQEALYGRVLDAPAPETPPAAPAPGAGDGSGTTPAEPAAAVPAAEPVPAPSAQPKPAPVPVPPRQAAVAAPTPTSRVAVADGANRKPKLKATEKLARFANAAGMTIEDYLLRLEDQGVSQETIDAEAKPKSRRNLM